eukprot:scaffold259594_cov79-Cyclotella_meneghiniana.AAC.1
MGSELRAAVCCVVEGRRASMIGSFVTSVPGDCIQIFQSRIMCVYDVARTVHTTPHTHPRTTHHPQQQPPRGTSQNTTRFTTHHEDRCTIFSVCCKHRDCKRILIASFLLNSTTTCSKLSIGVESSIPGKLHLDQ